MNNKDKLNSILAILLILSTLLTVYAFFSKEKAASPVVLVLQGKHEYNYEDAHELTSFWDNYPYWIMLSQDKKIDSSTIIIDSAGSKHLLQDVLRDKNFILFRFSAGNDIRELDTAFSALDRTDAPVLLLTDVIPGENWPSVPSLKKKRPVYTLETPLALGIEKGNLPYFFSLGHDFKAQAIFVPRKEISELTVKYLDYMKNRIKI